MSQVLPLVTRQGDRIAIVSGLRTPFARQATAFHGVPAVDLGKMVISEMLGVFLVVHFLPRVAVLMNVDPRGVAWFAPRTWWPSI